MGIAAADLASYYRAGLVALRFVEARRQAGRRFGVDADARWKAFRGHLTAAERLELLLRDANAEWPGAFGARSVFDFRRVAEDDAFGPEWPALDPVMAEELWREPPPAAEDVASPGRAFDAVARLWGLELTWPPVPALDAADIVWVAGPSAVAAVACAFGEGPALDWAAQVTCVATPPAHRQLACFAAAVADARRPAAVVAAVAAGTPPPAAQVILSDDATPEDRSVLAPGGGQP